MKATPAEMKAEAVRRMKKWGIFPETIRQFEREGKVSMSTPPFGAYYWLEGEDLDRVREFESAYHALVYTVVRSYTSIGTMDAYLYVYEDTDEWKLDAEDMDMGSAGAYGYNQDAPDFSESGAVGLELGAGAGLIRTW